MSDPIMIISQDEDEHHGAGPLAAWTCPRCTVDNQPTYLACDCCGEERPYNQIPNAAINLPPPPRAAPQQQQQQQPPSITGALLDSQPTQQYAAPLENDAEIWTCSACTFINTSLSLDCEVCGTPGLAPNANNNAVTVAVTVAENEAGPSRPTNRHLTPPPALHIPLNYKFNERNEDSSQKIYVLDCGCCGPLHENKEAVRVAAVTLPPAPTLLCLLRHFSCPANTANSTSKCTRQISRRDLEALLGTAEAKALDRGFYNAAVVAAANNINSNGPGDQLVLHGNDTDTLLASFSREWNSACRQLSQHCMNLAKAIADLHAAMITNSSSPAGTTPTTNNNDVNNHNTGRHGSGRSKKQQKQHQQREKSRPASAGVGYGGHQGGHDSHLNRRLKEEAAARQRTSDADTALPLRTIRSTVRELLQAEENLIFSQLSPLGWLPLGVVGILQGSPLAACLRLLLCNDSLMDITERREVYSEALQLVSLLASRQEFIPLLLVPADGDILAQFTTPAAAGGAGAGVSVGGGQGQRQQQQQQVRGTRNAEEGTFRNSKRAKTSGSGGGASTATAVAATTGAGAEAAVAAATEKKEESFEDGLARSCWKALQAFTLQCKLFMRSAEQLAGDGSEEDVSTVGTVLLVQETCTAVDEAVNAWKSIHQHIHNTTNSNGQNNASSEAGAATRNSSGAGPSSLLLPRNGTATTTTTTATAALKQQYKQIMSEMSFRSINLIEQGDFYFRNQLSSTTNILGDASTRLRRLMKEIATLSGQLPTDWESTILVVNDEERMDAFRALIFPPTESPYSNGAFFFDILLPPDYPASPPKVQFLSTGGGKIRFNPNLYDSGKVCLSLLGTWSGPSWDPGNSTLLQVLISIQAMILGESNPYGNEPGYESHLRTAEGKRASDSYNRMQRYNTIKYSMAPAVQTVVSTSGRQEVPKGFEEALKVHFKLKSGEIEKQLNEWKQENSAHNYELAGGGGGGGGGKNTNKNSMSLTRQYGANAITDKKMDEVVNYVLSALKRLR